MVETVEDPFSLSLRGGKVRREMWVVTAADRTAAAWVETM